MHTNFRINSPQVVCETIDGEVVIVNLEKGYYSSLLKTRAEVWSQIEKQRDRLSLIPHLTQTYEGSDEEITTAVDEFLEKLLHEDLIVEDIGLAASEVNGKLVVCQDCCDGLKTLKTP